MIASCNIHPVDLEIPTMQTAAFDTLATANALKEAGFEETQAAAIVDALRHAVTEEVATKANLSGLRTELKTDLGELRGRPVPRFVDASRRHHRADGCVVENPVDLLLPQNLHWTHSKGR